jgi:hypothetical protein
VRIAIVAAVVAAQLGAVVAAYHRPQAHFGFQMFNESSSWQADIYRVTAAGERLDVRTDWPWYDWPDLVRTGALAQPFTRVHADRGLDSTLDFFQEALDWVALNTPLDAETVRLEADVTYWENDRGPYRRTFVSAERSP